MKSDRNVVVVLVTVPDRLTGRRLARAILQERLAACVNLLPGVESHYWWQGKLERSAELLLLLKTLKARLPALQQLVLEEHPYDTPEFVSLPAELVDPRYHAWMIESVSRKV